MLASRSVVAIAAIYRLCNYCSTHEIELIAAMNSFSGQTDLSYFHASIGAIFPHRVIDAENASSAKQVEFFDENGFISGIPVLNGEQLAHMRTHLAALMGPDQAQNELFYEYHHNESRDSSTTLFHALGARRVSEAFHDLLFHQQIIAATEQLLGGAVRFWHDQIFVKPARDGGVVAWHQDYSYWTRTVPVAHLTC